MQCTGATQKQTLKNLNRLSSIESVKTEEYRKFGKEIFIKTVRDKRVIAID